MLITSILEILFKTKYPNSITEIKRLAGLQRIINHAHHINPTNPVLTKSSKNVSIVSYRKPFGCIRKSFGCTGKSFVCIGKPFGCIGKSFGCTGKSFGCTRKCAFQLIFTTFWLFLADFGTFCLTFYHFLFKMVGVSSPSFSPLFNFIHSYKGKCHDYKQ